MLCSEHAITHVRTPTHFYARFLSLLPPGSALGAPFAIAQTLFLLVTRTLTMLSR